jgi:hypothetical protein
MPLPIRDGNQSLTTLSTILVSNSHIPAHTVISFGTQGITDIATAVSGVELGPNTLNALENITVTLGQVTITGGLTDAQLRASAVTIGGSVTATISGTPSVTFSQASVTFGTAVVTGSTSILNFPATQTVTFSQASVTFGQSTITGSVSVLNIPATQAVTFSQATVTFGLISGTVTANPTGTVTIAGTVTIGAGTVTIGAGTSQIGSVTASVNSLPLDFDVQISNGLRTFNQTEGSFGVAVNYAEPITGTVTLGAGTAQIGSVTASISGTVPISISSVTVGNSVTIGSIPAISGTVTANINSQFYGESTNKYAIRSSAAYIDGGDLYDVTESNPLPICINDSGGNSYGTLGNPLKVSGTVTISSLPAIGGAVTANLAISSTVITSGSFTSITSATLVPANTARKMATVYNLGAGQLFINAGATATTLGGGFMVALSSGDFYECPYTTTTLSAIFATAGTASWVSH